MINRTVHMIFEPSGQPIPSEEEVQFEAQEIVSRFGWGLPLLEAQTLNFKLKIFDFSCIYGKFVVILQCKIGNTKTKDIS